MDGSGKENMVEQLQTFGTELTADSVETTPLAPHVLCCATYQLEQSTGKRLGCIQAYEFVSQTGAAAEADEGDTGAERAEVTPPQLRHRQTLRTRSGVLDTKWSRGPLEEELGEMRLESRKTFRPP